MRLRDESLKTGMALAWVDPTSHLRTRVLLFLVRGADDIEVLRRIQTVCDSLCRDRGYQGFAWHAIADPGQLSMADPRLFSAEVVRFEACEFCDLSGEQLRALLGPVLSHVMAGETELLPRAGGAVGGPAEGIHFLNRVTELENLAAVIRDGASLFLQAPRRMGKTSLLRRLQAKLDGEYATFTLNIERDPTPVESAARFRCLVRREGFRTALLAARSDPDRVMRESVEAFLGGLEKPLVLFVDELVALFESIRLDNRDENLRRIRTLSLLAALGEPLEKHKARLVVAGSVDCLHYLRSQVNIEQHQLPGLFTRLQRVALKSLDFQHPECELHRVLLGSGLVPEAGDIQWLREHLDLSVPFPALKFLDLLLGETRSRGTIGRELMEQLFRDFLRTTESFDDFREHLRRKAPDAVHAADIASEILSTIARGAFGSGASEESVKTVLLKAAPADADKLVAWLRDTFPVRLAEGRAVFTSRLFRHWWRSQMDEAEDSDG